MISRLIKAVVVAVVNTRESQDKHVDSSVTILAPRRMGEMHFRSVGG